ncbi:MAG: (d)CMP kinase [Candidatus Omnitrophica bacterium]|nr:(d)CMP kinase [Candidatus Omnitrophota bacterium]
MDCKTKTGEQINVVAIDGPAGSGKSTVAKQLAKRLNYLYLDTGAMYRALTFKTMQKGFDLNDKPALVKLAKGLDLELKMNQDALKVTLDGKDITNDIRQQSVTEKVHFVAKNKAVRAEMVKLQRKLAGQTKGAVLEGRDIGTVVFPGAKRKFYLDAQISERVKRRFKELQAMGQKVKLDEIARDIEERDQSDMTREVAPLVRAKDAVYVDTTDLSIEAVVERLYQECFTGLSAR